MKYLLASGLVAASMLVAGTAAAQAPTLNLSLTGANAYVWRGITMADQAVIQGDFSLAVPVRGTTLTGGVWANAEVDPSAERFSTLTDSRGGVGEVDLYAQATRPWGPATVALGVTALRFPEIHAWDTFEVYGSLALGGTPLAPTLVVRKDVDAVGGAYAELGLSHSFALDDEQHALVLAGVMGASTGQADDGDLAWYADEGITHLGASLATSFSAGGFTLTPQVNVTHGIDDFAKVDGKATRYGVALTISRGFPLGR